MSEKSRKFRLNFEVKCKKGLTPTLINNVSNNVSNVLVGCDVKYGNIILLFRLASGKCFVCDVFWFGCPFEVHGTSSSDYFFCSTINSSYRPNSL